MNKNLKKIVVCSAIVVAGMLGVGMMAHPKSIPLQQPVSPPNSRPPEQVIIVITDDDVLDTGGNAILHHQCGAYCNLAYEVVDQNGDSFDHPYSLTESFTDYQGPDSAPASFTLTISSNTVGDTQYFGRTAPACPGSDDHESFKQHFVVRYNNTNYTLSTVVSISRGRFSGTSKVDVAITTP